MTFPSSPGPSDVSAMNRPAAQQQQQTGDAVVDLKTYISTLAQQPKATLAISKLLNKAKYYRGKPTSKVTAALVTALSRMEEDRLLVKPYRGDLQRDQFLLETVSEVAGSGAGAQKITKQEYQTKYRPEDLEGTIQKVFQDLLGRDASKEELGKYISTISTMAAKPKNMAVSEYVDVSPGVQRRVDQPGFDPEAYLIKQLAGTDEAKARRVISYYDVFDQFVGRRQFVAEKGKLDISSIKQDIAQKEKERAARDKELADAAKRENLDKLQKSEIAKRQKRIEDLEKAKLGLKRQIFDLTQGGKIVDQKKLQDAIDGYNASVATQDNLYLETYAIRTGDYTVKNNKLVINPRKPAVQTGPTGAPGPTEVTSMKAPVVTGAGASLAGPSGPKKPKPEAKGAGIGVGSSFNPARFRKGEEASMTSLPKAAGDLTLQEIYDLVKTKYANVDSIFLYDDELGNLLKEAYTTNMDPKEFASRLGRTDWATRGAEEWRTRDAQKRSYNDLLSKYENQLSLATDPKVKAQLQDKIYELKTKSEYARGIDSVKSYIAKVASKAIGTLSDDQLTALATEVYDSALEQDPNKIIDKITARISYTPGGALGGAAGVNLSALRTTAAANGIDLDKQFGNQLTDWLQRLTQGESVETFKNLIRQQAKLGLPEKVAGLLDQGLDLEQIYDPYKRLMASVLEINPETIRLSDPTLRSAIGPDKEMSLYDFQRALRKDARWQYTDNARKESSDAVLGVLRDFGFQG